MLNVEISCKGGDFSHLTVRKGQGPAYFPSVWLLLQKDETDYMVQGFHSTRRNISEFKSQTQEKQYQ